MVDIDDVISNIDKALEDNGDCDVHDWVLEADKLAKTLTRDEINERCETFNGDRFVIPSVFGVHCECIQKHLRAYAKEVDEGYGWGIFVQCVNCKQESVNSIPFEICGRERVVASLAVCIREKADGY